MKQWKSILLHYKKKIKLQIKKPEAHTHTHHSAHSHAHRNPHTQTTTNTQISPHKKTLRRGASFSFKQNILKFKGFVKNTNSVFEIQKTLSLIFPIQKFYEGHEQRL